MSHRPDGALVDCAVEKEEPAGQGFGAAMVDVAQHGRLKPSAVRSYGKDATVRYAGSFAENDLFDTPPDWVKRPTGDDLNAVWPAKALQQGIDGSSTIGCKINLVGMLERCQVLSEQPADMGFGAAALLLAPAFRFKPAIKDGHPVLATVNIPINFKANGGMPVESHLGSNIRQPGETVRVLSNVPFDRTPTYQDLVAAWPAGADSDTIPKTTMICRLQVSGAVDDCSFTFSSSSRFERPSRELAKKFHVNIGEGVARATVASLRVPIALQFVNPAQANPSRAITHAAWTVLPAADDAAKLYPAAASSQGVKKGAATIACTVGSTGKLDGCTVTAETPSNLGFGPAALQMASMMQMGLWGDDGLPTPGATVRVPLGFEQPAEAVAAK